MERLVFKTPDPSLKAAALDYKKEHLENGETELHGSALLGAMEYEDWLNATLDNADEKTVHRGWVLADSLFIHTAQERNNNK